MASTGPQKASELGQRLREKLEADRSEIETLTRAQLKRLSASLTEDVRLAVNTIDLDIHNWKEAQARQSWWSWLRPVVAGLSVILGLAIGTAATTLYLSRDIKNQVEERALLTEAIAMQRETLAELHDQTGWIDVYEESKGNWIVVIPKGRKLTPGWTVGKRPAYKLLGD